jgi:hypothetical protein
VGAVVFVVVGLGFAARALPGRRMTLNPVPLSLDEPYEFEQALEIDDARRGLHLLAEQRRQARDWLQRAIKSKAEKEKEYRRERARCWARNTEGTAKEREDKVNDETAQFRYERDIAEGIVLAAKERLEEIDAERASMHRLVDWSMQMQGVGVS